MNEESTECNDKAGINVLFLGTGAAGGETSLRKNSSVLLDDRVLIDLTSLVAGRIPDGASPEVIFQTHSHDDHFDPEAVVRLGIRRMYVHESWAGTARKLVADVADKLRLPAPEVTALPFGVPVEEFGMTFTAVPANHATSLVSDGVLERSALYLVEKGTTRLLYATDTAGLLGDAARMIGIDAHVHENSFESEFGGNPFVHRPEPLTAIIMEATDGISDSDFRLFNHSSVQLVERTVEGLVQCGRYMPPAGQSVYITHLALRYREWPAEQIDAELPAPLKAASDGLNVVMR